MLDVTQPKSRLSRRDKATKLTETSTKTLYTPIFYGSPKAGPSAGNQPSISEPTLKRLQELSRMHVALAQSVPEVPASRLGSPACATVSPPPPTVSCGQQKTREADSDHELVPEVLADLHAGTEHSVAQNPRVGHLRKRIIEALEDCDYDSSHGKWAMVSSLLKIGVISGGTKWLGTRTDLRPGDISPLLHAGASGLGWCNAETEEEWLQWEKKFGEEIRLRSKVEKWKQGVVASAPVPKDLDVTVDAPVPRNSATARVPPPKTMTIVRPKPTTQDVVPPHRSTINRLSLLQDPLKDASPLGFSMAKRTGAARAATSKLLPRNKQPGDKSRGLPQNNSQQPKRHGEKLKSRPSTDARGISDSPTSDLSLHPPSFPSSQLVTSTPKVHNDKLSADIPSLNSSLPPHAVSTPLPKNSTVARFPSSSSVLRTYGRTRSSLAKSMTVPEVSSHKTLGKRKIERTSTEDEGSSKTKKPRVESSADGGDNGPSTWGADESFDLPQRQIESTVSLWPGAGLVAEQKEPPTTPLPPQPVAKFVDLLASAKKDKIMRKKKRAEAKRKSMGVSRNGDLTGGSVDPSATAEKHLAEFAVVSRPRSQDRTEHEQPLLLVSNIPSQLDEVSPPSPPATPKQLAPSSSAAMDAQVPEQTPAALPATPERRQGPSATSLIQRLSTPKQIASLFLTPISVKDAEAGSPMRLTVPSGKASLGDGPGSSAEVRVLIDGSPLRESALHSSPRKGDDEVGHLNLVVEGQRHDGHLGPRRQLDINLEPQHPLDLELDHSQEVSLDNPIYDDLPPSSPVPLDNEKQSNPFLQSQHHVDAHVDLDAQEAEHLDIVVPLRDHSLEPSSNVFKSKKSRRKDDDVYTFDDDSDSGSVYAIDAASDVDLSSPGKSLSSLAGSDDDDEDSDFGDRHELPVVGRKNPGLDEFELDGEFDPPFVSTQQPACNDVFPAKSSFGTPAFGLEPQLTRGGVHTPGHSKASQALLGPSHGTPMKFPSSSGYGYSSQIDVRARVEEVDRLLEKDVDFEEWLKDLSMGKDS